MKSTTIENYNNHFKFGSDGLLFKSKVNDKPLSKYSLTQITHYFNKIKKQMYNTKDNIAGPWLHLLRRNHKQMNSISRSQ